MVRIRHKILNQSLLESFLALGTDHVATSFVKGMDLLWGEIHSNLSHVPNNLVDERLSFPQLSGDKVTPTFVCNLNEGITSHVLNTYSQVNHANQ